MMEDEEDALSTAPVTPPPFCIDERVYCRDKDRLYEAIVRNTRYKNDNADNNNNTVNGSSSSSSSSCWEFLLHYSGWNNRWDRWINADCLLKDTEENRAIFKQQEQENNPVAGAAETNTTTSSSSGQKRSRSAADAGQPRSNSHRKRLTTVRTNTADAAATTTTTLLYSDYCELPLTLKTVLVDEYERLRRFVHVLPAPVPVRKVLNHFSKKKIKACNKANNNNSGGELMQNNVTEHQIQEFVQGLTALFQEALPVCLLYPQERLQYESLMKGSSSSEPVALVDVYGCEYLLRLFVRLPILLHNNGASASRKATATTFASPTVIGPLLTDLLVLLQKNRQTLFNSNYRLPLPNEWMNWTSSTSENKQGNNMNETKKVSTPPSPTVEMDTK